MTKKELIENLKKGEDRMWILLLWFGASVLVYLLTYPIFAAGRRADDLMKRMEENHVDVN